MSAKLAGNQFIPSFLECERSDMAMKQFWTNVQTAARFMRSRPNIVPPAFDHEQIASALRQSTFWLTPGSIKGYDPGDLEPLNDEERKRLEEGVVEFQEVAKADREMASVTDGPRGRTVASVAKIIEPDRIERGINGFLKILEVVRPDKYFDAEAFVIGKQIEKMIHDKMPEWVRGLTFETRH